MIYKNYCGGIQLPGVRRMLFFIAKKPYKTIMQAPAGRDN